MEYPAIIANPIYDVVFKFLMQNPRVSCIILSTLLDLEVIEAQLHTREVATGLPAALLPHDKTAPITLMRLDFKAIVRLSNQEHKVVIIELQKARTIESLRRFRNYLGYQYIDENNYEPHKTKPAQVDFESPYPIVSVYLLGYTLEGFEDEPVIRINRQVISHYSKEVLRKTHRFIEALTHDCVIAQIPAARGKRRNKLERLLNLFAIKEESLQIIAAPEEDRDLDAVVEVLYRAARDREMQSILREEQAMVDEYVQTVKELVEVKENLEETSKQLKETEEQLKEAEEQLKETEEQLKEAEEQLKETEEQLKETEEQLKEAEEQLKETEEQLKETEKRVEEERRLRQQVESEKKQIEQERQQARYAITASVKLMRELGLDDETIMQKLGLRQEDLQDIQ
ncbi:MAG: hypothetical protein RMJ44_04315 [Cytophagales bacterium]|nr:hypothetical protein [Bernardetiaceae bacterium]MDW8210289.1 hypothetical protein [Cytophagales bacterium]